MSALKLCIVTSEMAPFAKTGGLADVSGALVRQLANHGHDVRAFMPLYSMLRGPGAPFRPVAGIGPIEITIGADTYRCEIATAALPGGGPSVYFVDCPALYSRSQLYTQDADEHRRFLVLSRAALEACQRLRFAPHIVHCNDWHTALLPLLLKTSYSWDRLFAQTKTVLTIHNIGYQGVFPSTAIADLGPGGDRAWLDGDDLVRGEINSLRNGVAHADAVTTVSPTYAREICESDLGMGLQRTLRARADGIVGILNGVDYDEWDPRIDPYLSAHFWPEDLRGKQRNKQLLSQTCQLPDAPSRPIIAMITRLAVQKGIDLLFDTLPKLLAEREFGLVVLGSGEARYANFFAELAQAWPQRVAFRDGYDERLAHLIEAGSDIFLMPSHYEPCGLNQMYSLRYGTIPIVRRTGGLADSVQDADLAAGTGTGFVFNDYDVGGVSWALNAALDAYAQPQAWRQLIANAMRQDFSWPRQIQHYEALYRKLLS